MIVHSTHSCLINEEMLCYYLVLAQEKRYSVYYISHVFRSFKTPIYSSHLVFVTLPLDAELQWLQSDEIISQIDRKSEKIYDNRKSQIIYTLTCSLITFVPEFSRSYLWSLEKDSFEYEWSYTGWINKKEWTLTEIFNHHTLKKIIRFFIEIKTWSSFKWL